MNGMMRKLGRLAAVGAVALLLAASSAAPAAARPMLPKSGTIASTLYYVVCLATLGGEAAYVEFMGVWGVGCDLPGDAPDHVWVGDD
jgi:hypothetical protein